MWQRIIQISSVLLLGWEAHSQAQKTTSEDIVQLSIGTASHKREKTKLLLIVPSHDQLLDRLLGQLKKDLERSGECAVTLMYAPLLISKSTLQKYFNEGFPFVAFFTMTKNQQGVEGRLYASLDSDMLQGKKWGRRDSLAHWSAKIAEDIWRQLFGHPGSFHSKIAYIHKTKGRMRTSTLCVQDWATGIKEAVRSGKAIMVAPYFKPDGKILFFSEFTDRNVRLMATDLQGKAWCVIDGDGTCVGISCLPARDEVLYGRSGNIWRYRYDQERRQGSHTLIIKDSSGCACINQLSNGDIIYCSSGKIWRSAGGKIEQLIGGGYVTGPSCHEATGRIVYSQRVQGVMQLMLFDMSTGKKTQLTFDKGDKIDPCFSPCGAYIAYCLTEGTESKIMVYTTITGAKERLSQESDYCSCPAWSPVIAPSDGARS